MIIFLARTPQPLRHNLASFGSVDKDQRIVLDLGIQKGLIAKRAGVTVANGCATATKFAVSVRHANRKENHPPGRIRVAIHIQRLNHISPRNPFGRMLRRRLILTLWVKAALKTMIIIAAQISEGNGLVLGKRGDSDCSSWAMRQVGKRSSQYPGRSKPHQ